MMLTSLFFAIASLFIFNANTMEPPSILPISDSSVQISSSFGMRMHPVHKIKKMHKGIDIPAKVGTPIIAPSNGTISEIGQNQKFGNYIVIKHDDIYSTRYHHLHKIEVKKDEKISKGDQIGQVGSSGMSTAPHLHYEVLKNGENVNPEQFIGA